MSLCTLAFVAGCHFGDDDGDGTGGAAGAAGQAANGGEGAGGDGSSGAPATGGGSVGGTAAGGEAAGGTPAGGGGGIAGDDGGVGGASTGGVAGAGGNGGQDCVHNPALRVVPSAEPGGTGLSWSDPLVDLQQAIDQQASEGGGEVWILGGAQEFIAFGGALELKSCVRVYGGFAGTENSAAERDPDAQRTVFLSSEGASVTVSGEHDVHTESIVFAPGLSFTVQNSSRVTIRDYGAWDAPLNVTVQGSDVRIESSVVGDAVQATGSDVAWIDVEIPNGFFQPLSFSASRVLFQRVVTTAPVLLSEQSHGMFVDSAFLGTFERALGSVSSDADVIVVGSTFANTSGSGARLQAASAFVYNSSFLHLSTGSVGGTSSTASSILAPELEVSFSTFYDNTCNLQSTPCWAEIDGPAAGVNNSLFVKEITQTEGAPPIDPASIVITSGEPPPSNCASGDLFPYVEDASGVSGDIVALEHPCVNGGDSTRAAASRARLFEIATPYVAAPFKVDLSRYAPGWWESESAIAGRCVDAGAPDPGRHSDLSCGP